MLAIDEHRLGELPVEFSGENAACVVLASGGYPLKYRTGLAIEGLDADGQVPGATVYHAGTRLEDGVYRTAGGRVLGITCTAPTAEEALQNAYRAAEGVRFEGVHFRRDIGARNHR